MKNYPVIIVLLLVFIGVTAFAVVDNSKTENPLPASAQLLDRLTDEFQYLIELSGTAEKRLVNREHQQFASQITDTFQKKNRELCQLIIAREIPAKREVKNDHQKAIISLIPVRDEELNFQFKSLLYAQFDSIRILINRQRGLIEEREVLDFVDQILITQDQFRQPH